MCVFIYVWFCFYLFLYCMHVYCKYVCCLLSIHQPINVGPCIFITFYAVSRHAVSIYVFSLLYVHSMYVIYLFTCIDNSLSCIGIYLVLFGFSRYVCELICYCHSETSSNFAFLEVVFLLLALLRMIPTNLYHDNVPVSWLETLFFFFNRHKSVSMSIMVCDLSLVNGRMQMFFTVLPHLPGFIFKMQFMSRNLFGQGWVCVLHRSLFVVANLSHPCVHVSRYR